MRYILNHTTATGCIPCDEVKRSNDQINYILFRGTNSFVIMHRYSYNNGRLLIVPHTHESGADELPEKELGDIMKVTQAFAKMLKHVLSPDGSKVSNNIEKPASATIPEHLHVQMVPPGSAIRAISRCSTTPA